jgi:hypothetical protein
VSDPNSPPQGTQILGTFASLLGLLGIFLYFTGWIYRWAYFGWFRIEINRLDLPLRSFLFVPIQVFCGDIPAFLRTLLALAFVILAIQFTLWISYPLPSHRIVNQSKRKFHQFFFPLRSLDVGGLATRNPPIKKVFDAKNKRLPNA